MPQGMRVWDGNGTLIIDVSDRIMTVLGQIVINSSTPNGSVTVNDPRLALGSFWYFKTSDGGSFGGHTNANVTSTSSSVSVTVANYTAIYGNLYIVYGVY